MNLTIDLDTYYLLKKGEIALTKDNNNSIAYIFMYKNKCVYLNDDRTLIYVEKEEEINRFFIR